MIWNYSEETAPSLHPFPLLLDAIVMRRAPGWSAANDVVLAARVSVCLTVCTKYLQKL